VDPHHVDADPDPYPDSTYHPDANPDSDFILMRIRIFDVDAVPDPDPTFHSFADPDPDTSFQIKAQTIEKGLK
jgi:hypothetical protein